MIGFIRAVREVLAILFDATQGSRCPNCDERHGDLSAHMSRSPECGAVK